MGWVGMWEHRTFLWRCGFFYRHGVGYLHRLCICPSIAGRALSSFFFFEDASPVCLDGTGWDGTFTMVGSALLCSALLFGRWS